MNQQQPPSSAPSQAAPGPGPDLDPSADPCDVSRPTRTVKVRCTGTDDQAHIWQRAKRSVGFGWQVLHQAAALSPQCRWVLDIGEGVFDLPDHTLTSSLSHFTVRGQGMHRTRLRGTGDGHWQIWIEGCEGFSLEDLHLDVDSSSVVASGVTLLSVRCARVLRVRFQPIRFWGLRIGHAEVGVPIQPSSQVKVSDCVFSDHRGDSTQESLLAVGVHHLKVENCRFERIDGSAIAIGLWQDVAWASVQGCSFGGSGTGSVFGTSLQHITYQGCTFATRNGIRGGVHSDLEELEAWRAQHVRVYSCDFSSPEGNVLLPEGNGLELYSADHVIVSGCTFTRFKSNPVVIGGKTTGTVTDGDGNTTNVLVNRPAPHDVQLLGCTFQCTQSDPLWELHPEILIQHVLPAQEGLGNVVGLQVEGCTFITGAEDIIDGDGNVRWQAIGLRAPLESIDATPTDATNSVGITWSTNTVKGPSLQEYPRLIVYDEQNGARFVVWSEVRDDSGSCP